MRARRGSISTFISDVVVWQSSPGSSRKAQKWINGTLQYAHLLTVPGDYRFWFDNEESGTPARP